MRKTMRNTILAVLTAAVALCPASRAYGAQSSVIESVSVAFKTTYGETEVIPEPVITVSGAGCSMGDVQYRTEYENWKPGRKVRVEITVDAQDGRYFPVSLTRSQCKVSGADFVSARSLDDNSLQVKVDYKPVTVLGETQKAGWSSKASQKALWKPVEYAPGYALTLYGNNKVVKRMTVETNSVDLAEYMQDIDKTYYYEVKAVPVTSEQKKYLKEGQVVSSTDQEFDWEVYENNNNTWSGSGIGTGAGDGGALKGDNYVLPDGTRASNTWKLISGKWYYFDGNGNMARGWLNTGGRWFYMDQKGAMCTGWLNLNNGSWFYLGENGDMSTGWIQPEPGNWYYMNAQGYMERGWIQLDGSWYRLADDGRMQTGWVNDSGTWYYLDYSGRMAVNSTVDGWTIGPDGKALR